MIMGSWLPAIRTYIDLGNTGHLQWNMTVSSDTETHTNLGMHMDNEMPAFASTEDEDEEEMRADGGEDVK